MKTNAQEMKWIVMIILKDLKLGISEKSIFHEFHLDAEDLFNVTCDLKLVCERLRDRHQRHERQILGDDDKCSKYDNGEDIKDGMNMGGGGGFNPFGAGGFGGGGGYTFHFEGGFPGGGGFGGFHM